MPRRVALLDEGPQALLSLLARTTLGDAPFGSEPVGALEDELLGVARSVGACAAELLEQAVDRRVEVLGELMGEAIPEDRLRVEPLAGHEVPARRARADLGKREGRDHRRDDPELDLGERELGIRRCDRDVRARDESATAAERMPLDSGD